MLSSAGRVTVLQLTDLHLFGDRSVVNKGINPYASLRSVARHARENFPLANAVLLTGDISQDDTAESYRNLRSVVAEVWGETVGDNNGHGAVAGGSPKVLFVPGNHEDITNLSAVLLELPAFVGPVAAESPVVVTLGAWRLLLLCSHIPPGEAVHGALSEKGLNAAVEQLEALPSDVPVLVALHHPPVPPASDSFWSENCLAQPNRLMDALGGLTPRIKLLIHGHLHADFEAAGQGGFPIFCAPSTCHQYCLDTKDAEVDKGAQPGYRVLHLNSDGSFTTEVMRVAVEGA